MARRARRCGNEGRMTCREQSRFGTRDAGLGRLGRFEPDVLPSSTEIV
jgi:hypothetical protein